MALDARLATAEADGVRIPAVTQVASADDLRTTTAAAAA
jgi:hypothetical protein